MEFVKLTLADQQFTFRALDLDQLEELEPEFARINASGQAGLMDKDVRSAICNIAAASLKHRHPDITPENCRKLITTGTWQDVMSAVAGISAIEQAAPGEVPAGPA